MFKLEIEPSNTLHTKFGIAKINEDLGYYYISSTKEGNKNKYLHRLLFEDFYGPIPKGCHIHHKDETPLHNCVMNLQMLTHKDHINFHLSGDKHHFFGKKRDKETCERISKNISKNANTSGFYRVCKHLDKTCTQGFYWQYLYYEDGKRQAVRSVDINKLEQKVRNQGLPWYSIEELGEDD